MFDFKSVRRTDKSGYEMSSIQCLFHQMPSNSARGSKDDDLHCYICFLTSYSDFSRKRRIFHVLRMTFRERWVGQCQAALTAHQQSNTDQQMSFLSRWSSRTSSRIASGSCSRCH